MRNKKKYEVSAKIYFYSIVGILGLILLTAIVNLLALKCL